MVVVARAEAIPPPLFSTPSTASASKPATRYPVTIRRARMLIAPEDLPIGIVTALIGGFIFVVLMRRR